MPTFASERRRTMERVMTCATSSMASVASTRFARRRRQVSLKRVHATSCRVGHRPEGGERVFGEYAADWLETRLVKGRPLTPMTRQATRRCSGATYARISEEPSCARSRPNVFASGTARLPRRVGAISRQVVPPASRHPHDGVSDELIARNPCGSRRRHRARGGTADARHLDVFNLAMHRSAASRSCPRCRIRHARPGELLGLQRVTSTCCTAPCTSNARRTRSPVRAHLDAAKSEAGDRTVALLPRSEMN